MRSKIKRDQIDYFLLFCISFILSSILVFFLHTLCISDELGTMANAAYLANEKWAKYVGEYLAYYKYGLTLLYVPLCIIFKNPVILYRGVLLINAIIVSLIPVIVNYLLKRVFNFSDRRKSFLIAICIGELPAAVLWSKSILNDTMLILIPWIIVVLLHKFISTADVKKGKKYMLIIGGVSVYAYAVHSRGIVILIATFLIILYLKFICKKQNTAWFFGIVILLFILDYFFSNMLKNAIWGTTYLNNTLSNTMDKIDFSKLLSVQGIKNVIRVALGWIYSSTISTLGMFWIGISAIVVSILNFLKSKNKSDLEFIINIYIGLLLVGSMLLGIFYFSNATYDIAYNWTGERLDRFVYTRYMDLALGLIILAAFIAISRKIFTRNQKLIIVILQIIEFIAFYYSTAYLFHDGSMSSYMVSTCPFILPYSDVGIVQFENLNIQFLIIEFIVVLIIGGVLIDKKYISLNLKVGIVLLGYLLIIGNGFYKNHYSMNKYYYKYVKAFRNNLEMIDQDILENENTIIYITDWKMYYAFQFYFQDQKIMLYSGEKLDDETVIFDFSFDEGKYDLLDYTVNSFDENNAIILNR